MKTLGASLIVLATAVAVLGQAGPWADVESGLGRKGVEQGGVYKVAFPRSDLKVVKDGVPVAPGVALTSWAGFAKHKDQAMMMGDMVLLEAEVKPAMAALFGAGIDVTALHNHLSGTSPPVMYLHFGGAGDPAILAKGLRTALAATATPMAEPAQPAAGPMPDRSPDWTEVEKTLGASGQKKGSVIQFNFPRAEQVREHDMVIPPAMGVATSVNLGMVGDKAETSGDFVLLAGEVNPVAKTLLAGGIEVTAIHGHMLEESPRIFFMHFWGVDQPAKLARTLKAALDAAGAK